MTSGGNLAQSLRLMLVTDDKLLRSRDLLSVCREAVAGGVTIVQLRRKVATPRALADDVHRLKKSLSVPVLVNDRLDVAIAAGADGVHLGPDDIPVDIARRAAPGGFIIGASVGSEKEAEISGGADYWGIGPWRPTGTKADAGEPLTADVIHALVIRAGQRPCVVIGGVRPGDVPLILRLGAVGVAVVSGILEADDVGGAARAYSVQG